MVPRSAGAQQSSKPDTPRKPWPWDGAAAGGTGRASWDTVGMLKQRVTKAKRPQSVPAGAVEPEGWRHGKRFHISLTTPFGSAVTLARFLRALKLLEAS